MLLTGVAVLLGVTAGTSAPPPVPPVPAAMPKLLLGPGNAFGLFGVSNQETHQRPTSQTDSQCTYVCCKGRQCMPLSGHSQLARCYQCKVLCGLFIARERGGRRRTVLPDAAVLAMLA
jgi:hypothetical protein